MRLSKEGWVLNQESLASLAMPIAVIVCGRSLVLPFKRCRGGNHFRRAHQFCSARIGAYSRWRLNHITMMLARKPNTICNTMLTMKYVPCEVLPSLLRATMLETIRAKKTKSIHNTLNQRQRYHIAVADVRHFMRQNGFDFIAGHVVDQAGADGDE